MRGAHALASTGALGFLPCTCQNKTAATHGIRGGRPRINVVGTDTSHAAAGLLQALRTAYYTGIDVLVLTACHAAMCACMSPHRPYGGDGSCQLPSGSSCCRPCSGCGVFPLPLKQGCNCLGATMPSRQLMPPDTVHTQAPVTGTQFHVATLTWAVTSQHCAVYHFTTVTSMPILHSLSVSVSVPQCTQLNCIPVPLHTTIQCSALPLLTPY